MLSRANGIIRGFWKENNLGLMALPVSLIREDAGKPLVQPRSSIRRLHFGAGRRNLCKRNAKLNSQKRIDPSRGDDVARIITVFRAGILVISHNWSSFRTACKLKFIRTDPLFTDPARRPTWESNIETGSKDYVSKGGSKGRAFIWLKKNFSHGKMKHIPPRIL